MYFFTNRMKRYKDIRNDIGAYVSDVIIPLYGSFDSAHREDHAITVISQAMELLDRCKSYKQVEAMTGISKSTLIRAKKSQKKTAEL